MKQKKVGAFINCSPCYQGRNLDHEIETQQITLLCRQCQLVTKEGISITRLKLVYPMHPGQVEKVTKVTPLWKTFVPVAAALFIVLGVGLIAQFVKTGDTPQMSDQTDAQGLFAIALTDEETAEINAIEIDDFVDQYTTDYKIVDEMQMLDDISDDEYKYLEENLNIGEIL